MTCRILIIIASLATTLAHAGELQRLPLTLDLAGFQSKAELTLPPAGEPVRGGILLLHGATPADMDFIVFSFDRKVKSHILKDIAEHLSARGFAVLRYNKRHVNGPMQVDPAYGRLSLADLLDDADSAFDALVARPELVEKPVFVYGWSEGSLLAGALAARRDDIAGLLLQGAVADDPGGIFHYQVAKVTADFVEALTGTDKVTVESAMRVFQSEAGMLVKSYTGMALDPTAGMMNPQLNASLDGNQDGAISLRDEIAPIVVAGAASYLPARADFPVRPLLQQIDALRDLPVLILHGMNDANVPVSNGRQIAEALGAAASYREYPEMGHSLGTALTTAKDDFLPINVKVLQDMADWLSKAAR